MRWVGRAGLVTILGVVSPGVVDAQEATTLYLVVLGGVATLSGDARADVSPQGFAASSYAADNGVAVNLGFGAHVGEYLTVQASYIGNRNALVVFSGATTAGRVGFYQDPRQSRQHALVGDLLLYFRRRDSRVRPYLSGGLGFNRLTSRQDGRSIASGVPVPPATTASTNPVARVAVGIDVAIGRSWSLRYSFSESLSRNPIGRTLDPPGARALMNFQNLVGVVRGF